ncbi:MAG: tetratricopeptide repeat protein [Chloroflexi bacterium]|nr:tetratricopeptide repeat protein [Chloroflexota bacterium]
MVNIDAYQQAMREAANAAWDRDWKRAIQAYEAALKAKPNDPQALTGLAVCLVESGRRDQALLAYRKVSQLVPSDPLPKEKIAEFYEIDGKTKEAADTYLAIAEIYFQRKEGPRALTNWENAVSANPDLAQAHFRLSKVYEKDRNNHHKAIFSYLSLARILQTKMNQPERAMQALQRAMQIDSLNEEVRAAITDLKANTPIQPATPPPDLGSRGEAVAVQSSEVVFDDEELTEAVENRSPAEEAAKHAMGVLADMIFSGQVPMSAQPHLLQAIEAHQIGDIEMAIEHYEQVFAAGVNHSALYFNLGVLYQQARKTKDAFKMLAHVIDDPDYTIAGSLALGLTHFELREIELAAQRMVDSLRRADNLLNSQPTDTEGYDRLIASLEGKPTEELADLAKSLAIYLDDEIWRSKLTRAFSGYAMQGKASYVNSLMELILEGGRPEIAASMQRIDECLAADKIELAMEEVFYALSKSPDYLPAHRRMADVMARAGRNQEAADKIKLVANTYLIRGNEDKAADLFGEVLELWPGDMNARRRVIDMLKRQRRVDDAVRQYLEMGSFHDKMLLDKSKALEVFQEAMVYARDNDASQAQVAAVLRALADIEAQQLNLRQALSYYEQAMKMAPDDAQTVLEISSLYFRQNNIDEGMKAIDGFLAYCVRSGQVSRAIDLLEQKVRQYPELIPLRSRLAEIYKQQGRRDDAIQQLEQIAEIQIDAEQRDEAADTIRRIIDLDPPNVEDYRAGLAQLGGE